MSCSSSHVYGYGFECEDMPMHKTFRFIRNHIDTFKHIIQAGNHTAKFLKDCNIAIDELMQTNLDYMASLENNCLDYELVYDNFPDLCSAWMKVNEDIEMKYLRDEIVNIINDETGLSIEYQMGQSDDCEGHASIMLVETLPWYYSSFEKTFTSQDDFNDIIKPYVKELGYSVNNLNTLSIEYYG